ncbi:hypothetical protein AB1Y20_001447 [Prymnesium parvum]|uniref:Uncharacterized protein n=1 Tax=Prymnesium parvum TaxID=97485 RepID=A0AB34KC19_PRYPA
MAAQASNLVFSNDHAEVHSARESAAERSALAPLTNGQASAAAPKIWSNPTFFSEGSAKDRVAIHEELQRRETESGAVTHVPSARGPGDGTPSQWSNPTFFSESSAKARVAVHHELERRDSERATLQRMGSARRPEAERAQQDAADEVDELCRGLSERATLQLTPRVMDENTRAAEVAPHPSVLANRVEYLPSSKPSAAGGPSPTRPLSASAAVHAAGRREYSARPYSAAATRPTQPQRRPQGARERPQPRAQSAGARYKSVPTTASSAGPLHTLLLPRALPRRRKPSKPEWSTRMPNWEREIPDYDAWYDPHCEQFFTGPAASRLAHQRLSDSQKADPARCVSNPVHAKDRPASAPSTRAKPSAPPRCQLAHKPPAGAACAPAVPHSSAGVPDDVDGVPAMPHNISATVRRIVVLFTELSQREGLADDGEPCASALKVVKALRGLVQEAHARQEAYIAGAIDGTRSMTSTARPGDLDADGLKVVALLADQLEARAAVQEGEAELDRDGGSSELVWLDDVTGRACVIEAEQRGASEALLSPADLTLTVINSAGEFEDAFNRLREMLSSAWHDAALPDDELLTADARFAQPSESNAAQLATLILAARLHASRTAIVRSAIDQREMALSSLQLLIKRLPEGSDANEPKALRATMQLELNALIALLRRASVQVVEAVQRWRGGLWAPLPFEYRGDNYLLRMQTDLNSIKQPKLLEGLLQRSGGGKHPLDPVRLFVAQHALRVEVEKEQECNLPASTREGGASRVLRWLPVTDGVALRRAIVGEKSISGQCMYGINLF